MGKTQSHSIVVNGVAKAWTKSTITHDDVVKLSGLTGTRKVRYSWSVGGIKKRSGHVNLKDPINIAEGMAFTVT